MVSKPQTACTAQAACGRRLRRASRRCLQPCHPRSARSHGGRSARLPKAGAPGSPKAGARSHPRQERPKSPKAGARSPTAAAPAQTGSHIPGSEMQLTGPWGPDSSSVPLCGCRSEKKA